MRIMDLLKTKKFWINGILGSLAVLYVAGNLYGFRHYLSSPSLINDDLRQHLLPFYAQRYPGNFTDMFLVDYARRYLPIGYHALLKASSTFIDPILFSKALGIFLLLSVWVLSFLVGHKIAGPFGGFAALLLSVHCNYIISATYCGLFRSFGFPLLLAFIYCWMTERLKLSCLILFFQALIYPPVFLVCWFAFIIEPARLYLTSSFSLRKTLVGYWRFLGIFSVVSIAGFAILIMLSMKPAEDGEAISQKQAREMPEWSQKDGRFRSLPFLSMKSVVYNACREGLVSNKFGHKFAPRLVFLNRKENDPFFLIYIIALLPLISMRKPRPYRLIAMFVSSVLLFCLARIFAFRMGYPDRFVNYSLPVLAILAVPLAWSACARFKPALRRTASAVIVIVLLGAFVVYPAGFGGTRGIAVSVREYQPVYNFIKGMKGPVLLAGWPGGLIENVPLFAHKEILVDYEHAHPLYLGHYAKVSERILDVLHLTFAKNVATAQQIRDKYNLTHLILRKRVLTHEGRTPPVFAPFNDMASQMRRGTLPESFSFRNPSDDWIVYEDKKFQIIDLTKLL